ncbi:Poly [ADP-ribose] polymerase, partial [Actinidia chinensis var. chinensis]
MLFNVEAYRSAIMEFEINMSEMPLGKLSKSSIQRGFEALTEIQNLVTSNVHDPSYKESLIIDASNRFFTVIPSIHPHVIRDEDDLKSKHMDKPPQGKHSTKVLGMKIPQKSEFAKWRDEVVVPCGKPVASNIKASELMFNEYIVYNTTQ